MADFNFIPCYIDPGTGSMLFTILIGILGAAFYSLKMLFIKLRFKIGGGKAETANKKTPFVIFSDNKRYWSIFEPICREMDKRGKEIYYITASPDDPALTCDLKNVRAECIEKENKLFAKLNYINASIVLSTTPGLDVYQWKRAKDVDYYIHIPHAANDITLYRMFGIDYYDAVLLSGDYQIEQLRQLEEIRNRLPPRVHVGQTCGKASWESLVGKTRGKTIDVLIHGADCVTLLLPLWRKAQVHARIRDED